MRKLLGASAAGLALAVAAPLAAQPAPAKPTIQQQFDAASAALDAEHWQDALTSYQALERNLAGKDKRSLGIVRVREGAALAGLGRDEEAVAAIRLGLPALPASDASLAPDRYSALVTLGGIAEEALDYGEAIKDYEAAEPLVTSIAARFGALRGLIQAGMFYDAPAALARADKGLADAIAATPRDKKLEALFRTLRGRVLLNMARPAEALKELQRATDLLGGLTMKVDSNDLAARSDVAIAALLSHDEDKAREYLAWTGAGHWKERFPMGIGMNPPPCGSDLAPEDVAIVEFSIRNDGTVGGATPIYASRQGPSALLFAQAVMGWSWSPDQLGKIPPLFRRMTRMELRCSLASKHPSIRETLRGGLDDWLSEHGHPADDRNGRSEAARLKPLHEELARREAASGTSSPALLPVLADLADNALIGQEDRRLYLTRGLAIARTEKAPPSVLAWFEIGIAETHWDWHHGRDRSDALRAILAEPDVGGDAHAASAVRIALAETLYYGGNDKSGAIATLSQIPATPGLEAHDPLRAAALARIATLQLEAGNAAAARAAYADSGLNAQQCALLDAPPRLLGGWSDQDFPAAALRWGFDGWVKLEFDLKAEGSTRNVRPVISYPPFVFEEAAKTMIDKVRYGKTFRPDGGLGCGGMAQGVRFTLPEH